MKFRDPANGTIGTGTTGMSRPWVFLWPPLCYAAKGAWTHAIAGFLAGWLAGALTFGLAAFAIGMICAIMNRDIVRNHDPGKGWGEVVEG